MHPPFVSVVIPIYDRTYQLAECLNSVVNQTYQFKEVLLVLDGSPEETRNVVNQFSYYPFIRIIDLGTEASGSASKPRNVGIKEAVGDCIFMIDSDDIWMKTKIEKYLHYTDKANCLYGDYVIRSKEGKTSNHYAEDNVDLKRMMELGNPIMHMTFAAERDALVKVGGYDETLKYCEDYDLYIRLAKEGFTFKRVPEFLSIYNQHGNNLEKSVQHEKDWRSQMMNKYV